MTTTTQVMPASLVPPMSLAAAATSTALAPKTLDELVKSNDQQAALLTKFAASSPAYARSLGINDATQGLGPYLQTQYEKLSQLEQTTRRLVPQTRWSSKIRLGDLIRGEVDGMSNNRLISFVSMGRVGIRSVGAGVAIGASFGMLFGHLMSTIVCHSAGGNNCSDEGIVGAVSGGVLGTLIAGGIIPSLVCFSILTKINSTISSNLIKQAEEQRQYQEALSRYVIEVEKEQALLTQIEAAQKPEVIQGRISEELNLQREFLDTTLREFFLDLKKEAEANSGSLHATRTILESRHQERHAQWERDRDHVPYELVFTLKSAVGHQDALIKKIQLEMSRYEQILSQLNHQIELIDQQIAAEANVAEFARDYELAGSAQKAREVIAAAQYKRLELLKEVGVVSQQIAAQANAYHKARIEMATDVELAEARMKTL